MPRPPQAPLVAGIEAGGSKLVCAVGVPGQPLLRRTRIATRAPHATLREAIAWLRAARRALPFAAIGIASFGPLDPDPRSRRFGRIGTTPKPGWSGFDFVGALRDALRLPIAFDTDVNGAALAEHRFGAARGLSDFVYLTVGTGIGGGAMVGGRLLHGRQHPEMGHLLVPHDRDADPFAGVCPFHGDCLEGLASGPAMRARWERDPAALPAGHAAWRLEARYLALGIADLVYTLAPRRIVVGGGVGRNRSLLSRLRTELARTLRGYGPAPRTAAALRAFVVTPALRDDAGVVGALCLAHQALART